ncbi:MAG: metal-dependent hydrolase [Candidatus Nanoarchaeia archaeon]|nr:metal-dependent hydrolase [Candidatus Nanoarchaeia archaeon]
MDSVTHGLMGFFIALFIAKKLGFEDIKWPLVAGVIAGLAPDIDAISFFFGESGFYTYHRVATHSWIGVILLAAIIAIFFSKLKKDKFIRYFPLAMLGVLSHLFLDFVTASQGAQVFYPFSTARVALNISPGVDVYLLALFAAGIVVYKIYPKKGARIAATVLLFSLLIFSARFALTNYAEARVDSINGDSYLTPNLFNPFQWYVIKEHDSGYLRSEYTLFFGISEPESFYFQENPAVNASVNSKLVKSFLNFARFPYPIVDGNSVQWVDLKPSGKNTGFTATVTLDENFNIITEKMGM